MVSELTPLIAVAGSCGSAAAPAPGDDAPASSGQSRTTRRSHQPRPTRNQVFIAGYVWCTVGRCRATGDGHQEGTVHDGFFFGPGDETPGCFGASGARSACALGDSGTPEAPGTPSSRVGRGGRRELLHAAATHPGTPAAASTAGPNRQCGYAEVARPLLGPAQPLRERELRRWTMLVSGG